MSHIDKINRKVCEYVRSRHEKIKPIPTQGLFNFRCHQNAVQYAIDNEGHGVAEVIYIDEGNPILHYINYKDGEYFETTLGFEAERLEYYFIRTVHRDSWPTIVNEFQGNLDSWLRQFTGKFERFLFGIERVV